MDEFMFARGILVISMDVELGWGFRDRNNIYNFLSQNGDFERHNFNEFLRLLKHYNINVTFAIVGHLIVEQCFHDSCRFDKWFADWPCKSNKHHPLWYAPDLVESILSMPQKHEIASHSFSHIIFNNSKVDKNIIRTDFTLWKALAKKKGITLKSFVFPRNREAHLKFLREFGIKCFRGTIHCKQLPRLPGMAIVNEFLGPTPSEVTLTKEGLVVIPSTSYPNLTSILLPQGKHVRSKYSRIVPAEVAQAIHFYGIKRAIIKTIKTRKVLHLWTHESNLNEKQLPLIDRILRFVNIMRDKGILDIMTMGSLSEKFFSLQHKRET